MTEVIELETKPAKQERETREYFEQIAKLRKVSYDAHIKVGFDHEDALWLCCANEESE